MPLHQGAILLNPRVMTKAQTEIDSVVGNDKMPGFEDSDSLPYVHAIIKETLRYV
jgi:cytochrome P450